jgi:hypothetical protein
VVQPNSRCEHDLPRISGDPSWTVPMPGAM